MLLARPHSMNEVIKFIENKYDLGRKLVKGVPWGGSGAEHATEYWACYNGKTKCFYKQYFIKALFYT